MLWPWNRKSSPKIAPQTPTARIRALYVDYQTQRNLWLYVILSSLVLVCFWVIAAFLGLVDAYALSLPAAGLSISVIQLHRIRRISEVLRAAHAIQQQVDRAEAEKKAQEAGAGEASATAEGGSSAAGGTPGKVGGANGHSGLKAAGEAQTASEDEDT
jgi:hypothetical protein